MRRVGIRVLDSRQGGKRGGGGGGGEKGMTFSLAFFLIASLLFFFIGFWIFFPLELLTIGEENCCSCTCYMLST